MSNLIQLFQDSSSLQGSNASFIEDLYERFLEDPESVEPSWQKNSKKFNREHLMKRLIRRLLNVLLNLLLNRQED